LVSCQSQVKTDLLHLTPAAAVVVAGIGAIPPVGACDHVRARDDERATQENGRADVGGCDRTGDKGPGCQNGISAGIIAHATEIARVTGLHSDRHTRP
jgi:hypothetical protein